MGNKINEVYLEKLLNNTIVDSKDVDLTVNLKLDQLEISVDEVKNFLDGYAKRNNLLINVSILTTIMVIRIYHINTNNVFKLLDNTFKSIDKKLLADFLCQYIINLELPNGDKIETLNKSVAKLISEVRNLKDNNSEFKLGYSVSPGGILNAYREGDLSFDKAVIKLTELQQ